MSNTIKKWEYIVRPISLEREREILDDMGNNGWEMAAVRNAFNDSHYYGIFKRPIIPQPETDK